MYPGEGLVGVVYIGLNDAINTPCNVVVLAIRILNYTGRPRFYAQTLNPKSHTSTKQSTPAVDRRARFQKNTK